MTPEAQRIAIAEACGWKHIGTAKYLPLYGWIKVGPLLEIPDYPNDLNAMHEAEATLTRETNYYHQLLIRMNNYDGLATVRATAAQRAEAFLRTLNLWRDET